MFLSVAALSRWNDPRIHMFGNTGWKGLVHAVLAPGITDAINRLKYNGQDVRLFLHGEDTVDFGCGVGYSTSPGGTGIDASRSMLAVASVVQPGAAYERGLAEVWGDDDMCRRVTCAFLLHEQPQRRRHKILRNAMRICRDEVVVMDICPTYTPSPFMELGEPYVRDYLDHIDGDLRTLFGDARIRRDEVIPGHVVRWRVSKRLSCETSRAGATGPCDDTASAALETSEPSQQAPTEELGDV